jgi:hypothetical protein
MVANMTDFDHLGDLFWTGAEPGSVEPPERRPRYYITQDQHTRPPDMYERFRQEYQRGIITTDQIQIHWTNPLTEEQVQDMSWQNPQAAQLAREILDEETRSKLKETVTEAVRALREQLTDAPCGSVYSFMKTNDKGDHYWYACIKNGGKWYTTAQNPRVLQDDNQLIEWLISLEVYESPVAELTPGHGHADAAAIEATSTES